MAVASSAAAMPGAMALMLTSPAMAVPRNTTMIPSTVPSRPMYGPPAMAFESEPSLAPSTWFSLVRTASIEARIASMVAAEIELVSAPCSRRVRISLTATRYRRHSEACSRRLARAASSASSSRRWPTLAKDSRKVSLALATRATLRLFLIMMTHDCTIISTRMAMMTQASTGTALSRKPRPPKPKPDCSSSLP
ncbi:Uncharacterised protein [Achromobacter xylosoxidans]|nr:Uncharacterised protein [Achromobacter xylosoxidans]